jgi:multidrug efflux system outer membrane protein
MRRTPLGALAALLLAGCSFAPAYVRPVPPVPSTWPQGPSYAPPQAASTAAPDIAWRAFFVDPKLRQVIQLALDNNRDLRVAIADIAEARAQYRIQRAALAPHIDASFAPTLENLPASVLGSEFGGTSSTTGAATSSTNQSVFIQYYSATLGASNYELDLWGRVRNLSKQALEQYLATAEARRSTQISLISQVAIDYVTYAADLDRLNLAKATAASDARTVALTQARFQGGIASELDVRQAESAQAQAVASVSTYTTTLAQDVNGLTLLVGAAVPADLLPGPLGSTPLTMSDLPAGLDSTVLLRRPDVAEAEHQLKGYYANIGAARAAFFPTVALTGSAGSSSVALTGLFGGGTGAWTFTPTVTLPIFDGGQNLANLRYAKAERDAAVATYEKSIQTAFREVSDALAQRGQIGALLDANRNAAYATQRSLTLSTARYRRGSDTYLNVLTAQVTLYSAQQSLISARLTEATNLVTLYQALGGGVD